MELDWLRDFLALAEQGNFSRAAEARNVTQPAFSRRIRALEDWIGTPLFVRSAQGAAPTAAGATLRPLAIDILANLERARREAVMAGSEETSALSVAATHALSFTFFPGWIAPLLDRERAGPISLLSDSMEACEEIVLAGEVHFLLCHAHPRAPLRRLDPARFPSLVIGTDVLVPLCAPAPDGRPQWPLDPLGEVQPLRVLSYSPASGLGRILAALTSISPAQTRSESVFTSHLAATLQTMARDGRGMAWLPLRLAGEDLRSGRLVRAAAPAHDIALEIRLFRSLPSRNAAADRLWERLTAIGPG